MRLALPLLLLAATAFVSAILFWPDAPADESGQGRVAPAAGVASAEPSAEALDASVPLADDAGGRTQEGERKAAELTPVLEADSSPVAQSAVWRGRVVDPQGFGVADAEVVLVTARPADEAGVMVMDIGDLTGGGGTQARTDREGRFEMAARTAGGYRLSVGADGFAPLAVNTLDVMEGDQELGNFQLSPGLILAGRVIDTAGRPVVGARIESDALRSGGWRSVSFGQNFDTGTPTARSDEDGRFRLAQLELGSKRLAVRHSYHPLRTFEIELAAQQRERSDLVIELPIGGRIAGSVSGFAPGDQGRLAVTAAALDGPSLTQGIFGLPIEAKVDAQGGFELLGLEPSGAYELVLMRLSGSAESSNAASSLEAMMLAADREEISERVRAEVGDVGVQLQARVGSSLTFRLVDDVTGEPIEIFRAVLGPEGRSKELELPDAGFPDGLARFDDLHSLPGFFGLVEGETLRLTCPGYKRLERDDLQFESGQTLDLGELRMQSAGQLVVRVLDGVTGEPIRGASVQVSDGASGPDFSNVSDTGASETRSVSISMTSTTLGGGGGGLPNFSASESGRRARTDKEGLARLELTDDAENSLVVSKRGFASERRDLTGTDLGAVVEIELLEGALVTVRVENEVGEPVGNVRVEHRRPQPEPGTGAPSLRPDSGGRRTNDQGELKFADLEPGTHSFKLGVRPAMFEFGGGAMMFATEGGESEEDDQWVSIEVDRGDEEQVVLVRPTGSVLFGQVRESGVALIDASLSLRSKAQGGGPAMMEVGLAALLGGDALSSRSDAEGNYRIEQIEPGDYVLSVSHASRALPSQYDVTLGGSEQRFDIDLSSSVVEGRVLDAAGDPVEGAVVSARAIAEEAPAQAVAIRMVTTTSGGSGRAMTLGGDDTRAKTDADGRYRLRGLPTDSDLQVVVEPPFGDLFLSSAESEIFQLEADEVRRDEDLNLPTGGAARVEVLDAGGNPANFCLVFSRPDNEEEGQPELVQSGFMERGGLEPGVWWFSVRGLGTSPDPALQLEEQRVVIAPGEIAEVQLELE